MAITPETWLMPDGQRAQLHRDHVENLVVPPFASALADTLTLLLLGRSFAGATLHSSLHPTNVQGAGATGLRCRPPSWCGGLSGGGSGRQAARPGKFMALANVSWPT